MVIRDGDRVHKHRSSLLEVESHPPPFVISLLTMPPPRLPLPRLPHPPRLRLTCRPPPSFHFIVSFLQFASAIHKNRPGEDESFPGKEYSKDRVLTIEYRTFRKVVE